MERMKIRTYSELIQIPTFKERYEYLRLGGHVGNDTFGFDRYLNQRFYHSSEWKQIRRDVIVRDEGRDLAMPGYEIQNGLYIHHMNPIGKDDIQQASEWLLNPEYLVCVSFYTHQAIHYGDANLLNLPPVERTPGDTKLW